MKNYLLLIIFVIGFGVTADAQQEVQYTQFVFNKLNFNPAYAGSKEAANLSIIYRNQWVGIEGAPKTQTLNFHAPFFKKKIGFGVSITHDEITLSNNWSFSTMYAYRIPIRKSILSFGLQASLQHLGVRWDQIKTTQIGDGSVPIDQARILIPNVGAGFYFNAPKFYVGLSVPNLIKNEYNFEGTDVSPDANFFAAQAQHFYLMGGAIFTFSEKVKFKPAILMKYIPNAPIDMDINASFLFIDKIWAGVTYRLGDSVDLLAQYEITPQFKLGIAYDFTLSQLRKYNQGSFEVMAEYTFLYKKTNWKNPRYFF